MVDLIDGLYDTVEATNDNQRNKLLIEELNSLEGSAPIFETWIMASKMRIWLKEKK